MFRRHNIKKGTLKISFEKNDVFDDGEVRGVFDSEEDMLNQLREDLVNQH